MKVQTIAQYKILEFIKENFNINMLSDIVDIEKNAIKITDINGQSMIFKWENNEIVY